MSGTAGAKVFKPAVTPAGSTSIARVIASPMSRAFHPVDWPVDWPARRGAVTAGIPAPGSATPPPAASSASRQRRRSTSPRCRLIRFTGDPLHRGKAWFLPLYLRCQGWLDWKDGLRN